MPKNKFKTIAIISVIVIVIIVYISISYRPITGTVVDAETGKPIEGAVVLAEWTRRVGIGDYHTESVKVVEVITGKGGKFRLHGVLNPLVNSPDMAIYKKGYVTWSSRNIFPGWENREDFQWRSGHTYKLEKFKDTYSYIDHESFTTGAINSTIAPERKGLFFKTYSEGEENKVIREQDERNRKRLRGTDR